MIPARYQGAWRRTSLQLADDPPTEPQRVIFLQGPTIFADLRLPTKPGARTTCFAGRTSWFGSSLYWDYDVGLIPDGFPGEGGISWAGDDMIERGHFLIDGERVPFIEVWHREQGSDGEVLSLFRPAVTDPGAPVSGTDRISGRIFAIGDHSLSIVDDRRDGGELRATYRRRRPDGSWATVFGLGAVDAPEVPWAAYHVGDCIELHGTVWFSDDTMIPR